MKVQEKKKDRLNSLSFYVGNGWELCKDRRKEKERVLDPTTVLELSITE